MLTFASLLLLSDARASAVAGCDLVPRTMWLNSDTSIFVIVDSIGPETCFGSFYVDVWIDEAFVPSFGSVGDGYAWVDNATGMTPDPMRGGSSTVGLDVVIPGSDLVPRTGYWVDILVDSDGFVPESDESNNLWSIWIGPDWYPRNCAGC